MGFGGIKAVAEYKAYTAEEILELLQLVAPKMMARGSAHFSYGIAENLDDPKYKHYKYWSNPLETKLLPVWKSFHCMVLVSQLKERMFTGLLIQRNATFHFRLILQQMAETEIIVV